MRARADDIRDGKEPAAACHSDRRAGLDAGSDEVGIVLAGLPVEQLLSVGAPHRLASALERDQHLALLTGAIPHVHLLPAGLIRHERDPPPVGRYSDVLLGERARDQRRERSLPPTSDHRGVRS